MVLPIHEFDWIDKTREGLTVVDFWAAWCGPCIAFGPVVEKAAEAMKGVSFYKCNLDENQMIGQRLKVMSIPTLVVFKDGKEVGRRTGGSDVGPLVKFVETYIGSGKDNK